MVLRGGPMVAMVPPVGIPTPARTLRAVPSGCRPPSAPPASRVLQPAAAAPTNERSAPASLARRGDTAELVPPHRIGGCPRVGRGRARPGAPPTRPLRSPRGQRGVDLTRAISRARSGRRLAARRGGSAQLVVAMARPSPHTYIGVSWRGRAAPSRQCRRAAPGSARDCCLDQHATHRGGRRRAAPRPRWCRPPSSTLPHAPC
jgi:hypothetical protein